MRKRTEIKKDIMKKYDKKLETWSHDKLKENFIEKCVDRKELECLVEELKCAKKNLEREIWNIKDDNDRLKMALKYVNAKPKEAVVKYFTTRCNRPEFYAECDFGLMCEYGEECELFEEEQIERVVFFYDYKYTETDGIGKLEYVDVEFNLAQIRCITEFKLISQKENEEELG